MTLVDEIKARVDIVDLVGEGVQLRQSGRRHTALCPFHAERTPSFVVDPSRQTWHCFGACSEGGDIFSWVMKREGVDFREALRALADRAGLPLTPLDARAEEEQKRRERLRSANETAATFYRTQLLREPEADEARAYVEARGLSDEVSEAFAVGYAPDRGDALLGYLSARGFSSAEAVAAGLALEGERGHVDRFRGRLVFPIRDGRGRCVGFGGRILQGGGAKYLNTAQTDVFDKSSLLYGLDRAREAIRRADQAIIVEGYMDVIAAHQHGQLNVLASLGTALTEKQVALIKPLTRNIRLALDPDAAGAAATLRGIETTSEAMGTAKVPDVAALSQSARAEWLAHTPRAERFATITARRLVSLQDELAADIRIIALPPGQDPDTLIRRDPERWATLVREAPPFLDYRFARAKAARELRLPRERAALVEELLPLVGAITEPVVREEYLQRLAGQARVDTRELRRRMAESAGQPARRSRAAAAAPATAQAPPPPSDSLASFLLKLVVARPEVVAEIGAETAELIDDGVARELLRRRLAATDVETWQSELGPALRDYLEPLQEAASDLAPFSSEQACQAARQTVARLRERRLREVLRLQSQTIAEHEREYHGDPLALAAAALSNADEPADATAISGAARSVLESQATARELHAGGKAITPAEGGDA